MDFSYLFSVSSASISKNEEKSGDIDIYADNLSLLNGSIISSSNEQHSAVSAGNINLNIKSNILISGSEEGYYGSDIHYADSGVSSSTQGFSSGNAGTINIVSSNLELNKGFINSQAYLLSKGNAGNINIKADNIKITEGGYINTATTGEGDGGNINIDVTNKIYISDSYSLNEPVRKSSITSDTFLSGNGGSIDIKTSELELINGFIHADAVWGSTGNAGNVKIFADKLILKDAGTILAYTEGSGDAGSVILDVWDLFQLSGKNKIGYSSGVLTDTVGSISGNGGDIDINVNGKLIIQDNGFISVSSASKNGIAGKISINADKLEVKDGKIFSLSFYTSGGNISINAKDMKIFNDSEVSATVFGGEGGGGDVTINSDAFVALETSSVTAKADQGKGGNILINSFAFLRDGELKEVLNASSNVIGNDGTIEINSPELDISGAIAALPGYYLDVSELLSDPCGAKRKNDMSSLVDKNCGRMLFMPYIMF
jgi:large exoprotein involved in heme utilization and adhesion